MKRIAQILCSWILVHLNLCVTVVSNKASIFPDEVHNSELLSNSFKSFLKINLHQCSCLLLHNYDDARAISKPIWNQLLTILMDGSTAGVYIVYLDRNTDTAEPLNWPKSGRGVSKLLAKCIFGIVFLPGNSSTENLYKFLKDSYPDVRTEEYKFLFVSSSERGLNDMLSSTKFGFRFKFVVGLLQNDIEAVNSKETKLSLRSFCHFCENGNHAWMYPVNSFNSDDVFQDRSQNFQGRMLTISTPTSTRWLNEMHTVKNVWTPKRGIYAITLNHLMIRYNFTVTFVPSTGGGTGAKINDTHWVGTVGDVFHERTDIGHVTALTYSRAMVVDLTFPVTYEWLTFTTGTAATYHSWKTIYWPFTPFIWQLTAAVSIVVALLLKTALKLTRQRSPIEKVIEYMFAVVMEEGVAAPEQYPSHSVRTTITNWLIFGLVMSTAYRSKLTAFLAFPHVEHLPENFDELSNSQLSIGLQYIKGAAYQILKHSKHPTFVSIFKKMELEESDVRCFKRAVNSKFACISWDSMADYVYHKNLTDKFGHAPLVKAPVSNFFLCAGIVMAKKSILKSPFDHFINWATDTGMSDKWKKLDYNFIASQRKNWERETNQPEIDYTPPKNNALSFFHLSGGYYLFCAGIMSSIGVFIVEKIYKQHLKCMQMDTNL